MLSSKIGTLVSDLMIKIKICQDLDSILSGREENLKISEMRVLDLEDLDQIMIFSTQLSLKKGIKGRSEDLRSKKLEVSKNRD